MSRVASYWKSPVSPNPDFKVEVFNDSGTSVGIASYGVSPIFDRVYVFGLDIDPEFRRQGYGLAFLWHLACRHRLPISPVKELQPAKQFWNAARRMGEAGLVVLPESDMDDEKERWLHLQPEIDQLECQISARLDRNEPWSEAVGRGLDA
ncbi:GNAT family N-acetyltransferase [Litchfieldella rifensis]|uniref:GNAT family N-acetyltransferase n=1 Tax=Litchfieldella rifensis TaxID=762643 RepID=A0ABV7LID0_9GAMM